MAFKATKTRAKRVTYEQLSCLIDFISLPENKSMLTMKVNPTSGESVASLWDKLAGKLNQIKGPMKTSEEWRRFLVEWKSKVKKKARDHEIQCKKTGGGEPDSKPLTELEERLMSVIGWVVVRGNEELPPEADPDEDPEDGGSSAGQASHVQDILTQEYEGSINVLIKINLLTERILPVNTEIEEAVLEDIPADHSERLVTPRARNIRKVVHKTKTPVSSGGRIKSNKSSLGALHISAQLYAEGADKISNAIIQFADAIKILAAAITQGFPGVQPVNLIYEAEPAAADEETEGEA